VVVSHRARQQAVLFYWHPPAGQEAQRWGSVLDAFTHRIGDAARGAKLASRAHLELMPSEFGDYWMLSVDLLPAQPFDRIPPLVSQVFAEMKQSPLDASELSARRQALELLDAERGPLLTRAIELSRRECRPSRCLTAAELLSPETLAGIEHFDPAKALRVEVRHSVSASIDGDVERVP